MRQTISPPLPDGMRNPLRQRWQGLETGSMFRLNGIGLEVWRIGQPFDHISIPARPGGREVLRVLDAPAVSLICIEPGAQPLEMRDLAFLLNCWKDRSGQWFTGRAHLQTVAGLDVERTVQSSLFGDGTDDVAFVPLDRHGIHFEHCGYCHLCRRLSHKIVGGLLCGHPDSVTVEWVRADSLPPLLTGAHLEWR